MTSPTASQLSENREIAIFAAMATTSNRQPPAASNRQPPPAAPAAPVDAPKEATDPKRPREIGGPKGPEPTRYGDWEFNGRCTDF